MNQVFICGPSPHWMLVTSRGAMRLHPMSIDGPIESFSPFHNINCPKGFLYFNKQVRRGRTVSVVALNCTLKTRTPLRFVKSGGMWWFGKYFLLLWIPISKCSVVLSFMLKPLV